VVLVEGGADLLIDECVVKGSNMGWGIVVQDGAVCDARNCRIMGNRMGGVQQAKRADCVLAGCDIQEEGVGGGVVKEDPMIE
jgi:hypothetical protein